jgi:glycerophosphoryl diester phosphodiesterase
MRSPIGPGPLVYAHRGDSAHAPDNTLEAFELAVSAGTDGIELDVRRSADGVLILAHDPVHPALGPLSKLAYDDIVRGDPRVTTLKEALDHIPREVFVNTEVKNHIGEPGFDRTRSIVADMIELIERHDDPARILISSFDPFALSKARRVNPDIARGLLVTGRTHLGAAIRWTRRAGHATVNLARTHLVEDPQHVVDRAADSGLGVVVWTVDDPDEMLRLFGAGVAAIVTNDPGVGRAAVSGC